MTTPAVRLWYALLVSFIACVAVAVASVVITVQLNDQQQRRSDQRWCALLSNLDDTYRQTPPMTEAGRRQAAEIHRLRVAFGCSEETR